MLRHHQLGACKWLYVPFAIRCNVHSIHGYFIIFIFLLCTVLYNLISIIQLLKELFARGFTSTIITVGI